MFVLADPSSSIYTYSAHLFKQNTMLPAEGSRAATVEGDDNDFLGGHHRELDEDSNQLRIPLHALGILHSRLQLTMSSISFKRRQKARYSLFSSSSNPRTFAPGIAPPSTSSLNQSATSLDTLQPPGDRIDLSDEPSVALDGDDGWATEGTGRRFYDDLTAIDWIFEYTKERLRQRNLERRTGLIGYFAKLLDPSQLGIVLIGTGIAAGLVAAAIDIVANWLGDLKEGYCRSSFYLSRNFCCWGFEGMSVRKREGYGR
jgi:chloride channel 3/4/5